MASETCLLLKEQLAKYDENFFEDSFSENFLKSHEKCAPKLRECSAVLARETNLDECSRAH